MTILLVRPRPSPETIGLQHVMVVEPLELEILGALIPPEDRGVIVDMILEKEEIEYFLDTYEPRVLCVTGYVTNVPGMIDLCRRAKQWSAGITTVLGGVHCEVCPGDLDSPYTDYRVHRNAVETFPRLLELIKGRGPKPRGVLSRGEAADTSIPVSFSYTPPRRSLVADYMDKYFYIFHNKVALIKTSFGCPYTCNFCFCREITGHKYFERPMEEVLNELEVLEQENIYIVDDDFLVSRERVEGFLDGLQHRRIKKNYLIYGRADFIAKNEELIQRFARGGLKTVIVGVESFFEEELELYNKGSGLKANIAALKILRDNRIDIYATLIIPPHWDREQFRKCGEFLLENKLKYVNLQPYTPLHGTGAQVDPENLLIPYSDYEKWDLAHVTIRPEKMSVREFYREIILLYQKILFQPKVLLSYLRDYSPGSLWKMLKGSARVRKQYLQKMKEAAKHA